MAATMRMRVLLASSMLVLAIVLPNNVLAHRNGPKPHKLEAGQWFKAHATFYNGDDIYHGGACGYDDLQKEGYGMLTTALSTKLFENGATCGACFEIKCDCDSKYCIKDAPPIIVSATNFCPPNYGLSSDNGGWCNPPREHFDLAQPAYEQIAQYSGGIVPVFYRRVPCKKQGGITFLINGNPYFNLVTIENVGGAGDLKSVEVKGEKVGWTQLTRNWGEKWVSNINLVGQSLSFRVTTSDGCSIVSKNVIPKDWQFGQTYVGKNFH